MKLRFLFFLFPGTKMAVGMQLCIRAENIYMTHVCVSLS